MDHDQIKNEKVVELEKQKKYNEKIANIIASRDNFRGDTKGLRLDYFEALLKNMRSQKDELTDTLKGIQSDTEKLRKAKDIEAVTVKITEKMTH